MTPYYADDLVTLYHGDCRDVLPDLPYNTVDLMLSDAPYGIDFRSQAPGGRTVAGDGTHEAVRLLREAMFAAAVILRTDAHVLLFSGWQGWPAFYEAVSAYFTVRNALIWHKGGGGAGNILANYIRDYEVILYAAGIAGRDIGGEGRYSSVINSPKVQNRTHPTEKPVALLQYLIRRHAPADGLVLDPFSGSGSTLVAARLLNRRAIGIEIEERYCEVAARRCSQEVLSLSEPIVATMVAQPLRMELG